MAGLRSIDRVYEKTIPHMDKQTVVTKAHGHIPQVSISKGNQPVAVMANQGLSQEANSKVRFQLHSTQSSQKKIPKGDTSEKKNPDKNILVRKYEFGNRPSSQPRSSVAEIS